MNPQAVANIMLLLITSLTSIAFGFDRVYNHNLPIGGVFFIAIGTLAFISSLAQVFFNIYFPGYASSLNTLNRYKKNKETDKEI